MTLFERDPTVIELRDYQLQQQACAFRLWQEHQALLLVSSVGSGKTTTFSSIVSQRVGAGRVLVLAHRTELVDQAIDRLRLFGIEADRDQAGDRASHGFYGARVIVGTIQTVIARIRNYDPSEFATVVIDEAHHATASSYRKIKLHFSQNPNCKILGVTGTPDRSDEEALGQIFDAVVEPVYGIEKAIEDGWLVSPLQQCIEVSGLDFSNVRTTAGDLNGADLAEIMDIEGVCHEIASSTIQAVGSRPTIVFASSVKSAEMISDILNRHRSGCADWVCGQTPPDKRRMIFDNFRSGRNQYLCNVGITTEGTDLPFVAAIANGRPTKSRALYEQMTGRGLRTLPDTVEVCLDAVERKAAIASSAKPDALILDFVGNSGKHKLCTVTDILGGNISEDVIQAVNLRIRKKGVPVNALEEIEQYKADMEAQRKAKEAERKRRAGIVGNALFSAREVDAFDVRDSFNQVRGWDAPTEAQVKFFKSRKINAPPTRRQASAIIGEMKKREALQPIDPKYRWVLINKLGYTPAQVEGMSMAAAKRAIAKSYATRS